MILSSFSNSLKLKSQILVSSLNAKNVFENLLMYVIKKHYNVERSG